LGTTAGRDCERDCDLAYTMQDGDDQLFDGLNVFLSSSIMQRDRYVDCVSLALLT